MIGNQVKMLAVFMLAGACLALDTDWPVIGPAQYNPGSRCSRLKASDDWLNLEIGAVNCTSLTDSTDCPTGYQLGGVNNDKCLHLSLSSASYNMAQGTCSLANGRLYEPRYEDDFDYFEQLVRTCLISEAVIGLLYHDTDSEWIYPSSFNEPDAANRENARFLRFGSRYPKTANKKCVTAYSGYNTEECNRMNRFICEAAYNP